jgi:hypothetical protein
MSNLMGSGTERRFSDECSDRPDGLLALTIQRVSLIT